MTTSVIDDKCGHREVSEVVVFTATGPLRPEKKGTEKRMNKGHRKSKVENHTVPSPDSYR